MRLLVIGGSNSVSSEGYVNHLRTTLGEVVPSLTLKNLSVGGTTTLSGVGRLYETFANEEFDFILYEYTINDSGTFIHRSDGIQSYLLCLQILLSAAADLYPSAVFVPLLLAQQKDFSPAVVNLIHAVQISIFSALSVPYIDVRQWMAELFLGKQPQWLYKDASHYAIPQATSMIGSLIAAHLLQLVKCGAESVHTIFQKFMAMKICRKVMHTYMPAESLLPKANTQIAEVSNRLMHLRYARLQPGSSFSIKSDMFPLAIYLKSDAHHGIAQISVTTEESVLPFTLQTLFSTCHADTAVHNFIYSSIPVPLLFGDILLSRFISTEFTLSVPPIGAQIGEVKMFDAFVKNPNTAQEGYLDMVGLLLVKDG